MKAAYVKAMEALYILCATVSGVCIVVMTIVIPYGVYKRYVVNHASSWPEPLSVLLVILFTFFAAAACYRADVHIAVSMVVEAMPPLYRRVLPHHSRQPDGPAQRVHGAVGHQAGRGHLEQHHRRISVPVGRHHLHADPDRRLHHAAVRH